MKTLRLLGMALIAVFMCGNFTACSSDDDGDSNKSTIELLKGTWFDEDEEDYPYFIMENEYLYFSPNTSTVTTNRGLKYKYTFDSQTNIITCYQYDFEEHSYSNEAIYFKVTSISSTKLILEIEDFNDQTGNEYLDFIRK